MQTAQYTQTRSNTKWDTCAQKKRKTIIAESKFIPVVPHKAVAEVSRIGNV